MHILVIFDIPNRHKRKDTQDMLSRLGFRRLFPNTYERIGSHPSPRDTDLALREVLRNEVFTLRIYSFGGRCHVLERWGR